MKGPRESQRWGNKRVQFQEPYNKMPKSSQDYGTSSGAWKPVVSFWEREFCESVGLTWNQVCDNNNELEGFEPVLQWDDSSALEAFQIAKQRYWASRNGLHFEIPLPSPDLYIDDVDWNLHEQEGCDLPERKNSSSEEEHKRPYCRRGKRERYQGRRRNMSRQATREHRQASDLNGPYSANISVPVGWPDNNNATTDAPGWKNQGHSAEMTGAMDWSESRQNVTETSKDCAPNQEKNTMVRTGWEEPYGSGWDAKRTDGSGWEIPENKVVNSMGWEQEMDSGWNTRMTGSTNCLIPENAMETSNGWGNQTEPTRNSTVTSKTGWTDSGNAAGTSNGWGDQAENGLNMVAGSSGWTTYEDDKCACMGWGNGKSSGWSSKPSGRSGWTTPDNAIGWESRAGWVAPFVSQEQVVATGWGEQFPGPVHPHQNHALMPTYWNSMPQGAQQWQSQPSTWNSGPADSQIQYNSNWGGPTFHPCPQGGSSRWVQPSPYSQSSWHPGHWRPRSQYGQGSYHVPNSQHGQKKERGYRVNDRHNQR
eukprot:Gb_03472 [translate_table: standard]